MRKLPFAPIILTLFFGSALLILLILHRPATTRIVVFSNLTVDQTQTVSSVTIPTALEWKMEGEIQGTGSVTIGNYFLNHVTGRFSSNGTGDWYATNATVMFSPEQPAKGKIQVYLRFVGVP